MRVLMKLHGQKQIHTFSDLTYICNGRFVIDKHQSTANGLYYEGLQLRVTEGLVDTVIDNLIRSGYLILDRLSDPLWDSTPYTAKLIKSESCLPSSRILDNPPIIVCDDDWWLDNDYRPGTKHITGVINNE